MATVRAVNQKKPNQTVLTWLIIIVVGTLWHLRVLVGRPSGHGPGGRPAPSRPASKVVYITFDDGPSAGVHRPGAG